jgi:exopolyphosphatase/guanosine-5'-triphosphate,3'-diphosphate pyrophosphatase
MTSSEARAVIDIGSHSVLLLAASGGPDDPEVLIQDHRITALGAGLDESGRIETQAAVRTRDVLEDFLERIRALGVRDITLVGTSALREARNRNEALNILSGSKDLRVLVLSEAQEARLTRAGALSGLDLDSPGDQALVADLGGRSTELTWPGFSRSVGLGCQRASDSVLTGDPPLPEQIDRLRRITAERLAELPAPPGASALICSGGTSTSLASVDLALVEYRAESVHGHVLSSQRLKELSGRLVSQPLADRRKIPGLEPDRAGVLPAGALILDELCDWHGGGQVVVSARGLTWGTWLHWDLIQDG